LPSRYWSDLASGPTKGDIEAVTFFRRKMPSFLSSTHRFIAEEQARASGQCSQYPNVFHQSSSRGLPSGGSNNATTSFAP